MEVKPLQPLERPSEGDTRVVVPLATDYPDMATEMRAKWREMVKNMSDGIYRERDGRGR